LVKRKRAKFVRASQLRRTLRGRCWVEVRDSVECELLELRKPPLNPIHVANAAQRKGTGLRSFEHFVPLDIRRAAMIRCTFLHSLAQQGRRFGGSRGRDRCKALGSTETEDYLTSRLPIPAYSPSYPVADGHAGGGGS
jgi:hypothetical protein